MKYRDYNKYFARTSLSHLFATYSFFYFGFLYFNLTIRSPTNWIIIWSNKGQIKKKMENKWQCEQSIHTAM